VFASRQVSVAVASREQQGQSIHQLRTY
jgi:hypothetical protein